MDFDGVGKMCDCNCTTSLALDELVLEFLEREHGACPDGRLAVLDVPRHLLEFGNGELVHFELAADLVADV